jgi:hypothetical protein
MSESSSTHVSDVRKRGSIRIALTITEASFTFQSLPGPLILQLKEADRKALLSAARALSRLHLAPVRALIKWDVE